jgi:hypothetical protein
MTFILAAPLALGLSWLSGVQLCPLSTDFLPLVLALCPMPCAPCPMPYALCAVRHAVSDTLTSNHCLLLTRAR